MARTPGLRRLLRRPEDRSRPPASQLAQLEQDAFARLVGEVRGQDILDLGCGDARGGRLLIERGARRVIALDHSLAVLGGSEAFRHPAILRIRAIADRLPLTERCCHLVVARRLLSAVADLDGVLEETAAILRPGGRLVITDIHPFELLRHSGASREGEPGAHLVADYLEVFGRWGFELTALEEPRWQGFPRVLALSARRPADRGRPPREGPRLPASTFDGRRLVSRRSPPTTPWRRKLDELADGAAHLTELGWHGLFHLARARRPDVERLAPTGNRRILMVAARPGDEMLGAAATLLAHRRAGDPLCVVHATDGRHDERILDLRRSQLAALRRHEASEATQLLGAEWHWLAEDETDPDHDELFDLLASRLRALLESYRPEIVYAPCRITTHPQVETVSRALAAALREEAGTLREIRIYPLDVPLGPVLWSAAFPTRRAELAPLLATTYLSRQRADAAALRRRRYDAELLGLPGLLETFWQLGPGAYRQLHRAVTPPAVAFHPLRLRPWSDPLAYLRGLRERRRLLRSTITL